MSGSDLVVYAFATLALAWLLVYGIGPASILVRFRRFAGVEVDSKGRRSARNWIGELLNCEVCTSCWISVPLAIIAYFAIWLLYPLAAVGVVILVMRITPYE